jgi:hypothetical protein
VSYATRIPNSIPPSWANSAWFIDPANSTGVANDNNSGVDALHPVRSFNGGIVSKWGTTSPTLRQNTTFTWLSSQPAGDGDPVIFTPVLVGAYAQLQGLLGVAQELHAGLLASVTAKNRATGHLLQADLGFAAPPGSLVFNSTRNAYAWVYANVSGTLFTLSQSLSPATLPIDESSTIFFTEQDTWVNTDAFVIYQPTQINLVHVEPLDVVDYAAPNFIVPIQLYHLAQRGATPGNDTFVAGVDVIMVECSFEEQVSYGGIPKDTLSGHLNCYLGAGSLGLVQGISVFFGGVIRSSVAATIINYSLIDQDPIFDASVTLNPPVGGDFTTSIGYLYIGPSGLIVNGSTVFFESQAGGDLPSSPNGALWGPGALDIIGSTRVIYADQSATQTFLNTGGIKLNGLTNAYSVSQTDPATWHFKVLTPTSLDAGTPVGLGGLAINPGGASIQFGTNI